MAIMMANTPRWSQPSSSYHNNHNNSGGHYALPEPVAPPTNPRSNFYLIICYVCQEVAKPNQEHTLHYGGIVCYSCRAFFRRAHQKTKNPKFSCKRGGTCEVSVANRRRCQQCRYNRCLMAGMTPDAVLTDDQKVIRFRKTILKRRQVFGSTNVGSIEEEEEDEEDQAITSSSSPTPVPSTADNDQSFEKLVDSVDLLRSPKIPRLEELLETLSDPNKETVYQPEKEEATVMPTNDSELSTSFIDSSESIEDEYAFKDVECLPPTKSSKNFQQKIDSIMKAYNMAAMQLNSPCYNQIVKKLTAIQFGDNSVNIGKKELLSFIIQKSELFRHFALLHRHFVRLNKNDQRLLLARNTPLYVQLCLGSYFGAPSSKDQLVILQSYKLERTDKSIQCKNSSGFSGDVSEQLTDLKRFNAISRLFRCGADLDHYGQLINQIKPLNSLDSLKFRAVLSYAIMFDFDDSLILTNPEAVTENRIQAEKLIKTYFEGDSLNKLKVLFVKMAAFCACNIAWDGIQVIDENETVCKADPSFKFSAFNLTMTYTDEEELWLGNQFKHINEAFRSVTIGDDMTNEFFMYSLGVPLSKRYMKGVITITLERMWRIFNVHSEFKELPSQTQLDMMSTNGPVGLAIMVSRYESMTTGIQQIQEGFGELDEVRWKENYFPTFQNFKKVRKIKMKDVVGEMSVKLSEDQMSEYVRLISYLGPIASDPVLYKLIMLLALFKPVHPGSTSCLSGLQSTYMTIVRRRADWMFRNEKSAKNFEMKKMVDKMSSCIESLEKLSEIMLFILNKQ